MNKSVKITLSMIVKDEEKYLRECLESVKDIVGEIIIVDTGSTDNTIKIAEEFGAKIYQFKWINDFSAARNFALSKSSGEWILYLDADERLSDKSLKEIKRITSGNKLIGFKCLINSIDEFNRKPHFMKYTRLFHNALGIKFTGSVHEQIEGSLLANGFNIIDSKIEIIHLGYNIPSKELKKKANRNLTILKEEYDKNNSAYNAFQLANTYCVLKEYDYANKYYSLSVKNDNLKNEYKAHAYLNLSDYELKKQNINAALDYTDKGLRNDPSNTQLNLLASDIFSRLNDKIKSIEFCKKAYRTNNKILSGFNQSNLSVVLKPEAILSKGIYYSLLSDDADNLRYFLSELRNVNDKLSSLVRKLIENKTLSSSDKRDFINSVSKDNIDTILTLTENYIDKKLALELLLSIEKVFENNSKYLKTLGLLFSETNMFEESVDAFERSLKLEEKEPAAVFYLISVLVRNNKLEKIPGLLLFAEKEFGDILEFKKNFELLKEKLGAILN